MPCTEAGGSGGESFCLFDISKSEVEFTSSEPTTLATGNKQVAVGGGVLLFVYISLLNQM